MNAQLKPVSIIGTIQQGTAKRFAHYALVSVTMAVLLAIAVAMSQTLPHRPSRAVTRPGVTMQQRRFLEVNTEWLPTSVTPDVLPANVQSGQARFLEVNTMLGLTANAAPAVQPASVRKLIEVNTDLGITASPNTTVYPYGETLTPVRGPR